jgi:hypothetical protein
MATADSGASMTSSPSPASCSRYGSESGRLTGAAPAAPRAVTPLIIARAHRRRKHVGRLPDHRPLPYDNHCISSLAELLALHRIVWVRGGVTTGIGLEPRTARKTRKRARRQGSRSWISCISWLLFCCPGWVARRQRAGSRSRAPENRRHPIRGCTKPEPMTRSTGRPGAARFRFNLHVLPSFYPHETWKSRIALTRCSLFLR